MTIAEFCECLSATECSWHVNSYGEITDDNDDCPLWSVYREMSRDSEEDDVEDYIAAGEALGLRTKLAGMIAAAADNRGQKRLRRRLLKAVGIEE